MVTLPDAGFTTKKITLILVHKELGMWVLALSGLRIIWRLISITPFPLPTTPPWQHFAATLTHGLLYFLIIALPLSGWLMSSAGGFPVFFLSHLLPDIMPINTDLFLKYRIAHKLMGYLLILVLSGHIGAALVHHFIEKDNTLRRMWFFCR